MKVLRYDMVEGEIELFDPKVTKTIKTKKEVFTNGKCKICKSCWLNTNNNGLWYCECGGPFNGYINVDTGEITT